MLIDMPVVVNLSCKDTLFPPNKEPLCLIILRKDKASAFKRKRDAIQAWSRTS